MNRKTNLFYLSGNDSKFLTFDNYSEALTGDILATDWKLYPSRFLCIKIDNLNKGTLIKEYLTPYYENKLAFLRDQEDLELYPLNYLLECLILYASVVNSGIYTTIDEVENAILNGTTNFTGITFAYASDIVEQDYNGTYADIICTISPNKRQKFKINPKIGVGIDELNKVNYDKATNVLYGWENDELSESIEELVKKPNNQSLVILDSNNVYYSDSAIKSIEEVEYTEDDQLQFNIIIPLFDLTNIKADSVKILEDSEDNENSAELILNSNKNVPLGIYFTDTMIELDKDNNTKFAANWSLLISMQFKSFPFSYDIQQSWDNSDAIKDAYLTFAQILSKQTDFIDLLNRYNELITGLQNKISKLESGVSNISSTQNIDELIQRINTLSNTVINNKTLLEQKINDLQNTINNSRLKWKVKNN